MASRSDSHILASEAIRQLGIAIDAVAARTGARMSGSDPALLAAMLSTLTPSEQAALAEGRAAAVLGKLETIAARHAEQVLQQQTGRHAQGVTNDDAAGQAFYVEARRGPRSNLWDQLAGRASNEARSGSSARFADAGMGTSIPGNADMRGVTMANYYTSPLTSAIVGTGMSYGTFDYLRGQGFGQSNIAHAGRDARALGFSANDKAAVRDHAIIRKHDPQADRTNDHLQNFRKGLEDSADFKKAVDELDAAKTGEDKDRIMEKINKIADEQAKKHGVHADITDQTKSVEVRKAIERRKDAVVRGKFDTAAEANTKTTPQNEVKKTGTASAEDAAVYEAVMNKAKKAAPKDAAPSPTK